MLFSSLAGIESARSAINSEAILVWLLVSSSEVGAAVWASDAFAGPAISPMGAALAPSGVALLGFFLKNENMETFYNHSIL